MYLKEKIKYLKGTTMITAWILTFILAPTQLEVYGVYSNEPECRIRADFMADLVPGKVVCIQWRSGIEMGPAT